MRNLKRVLSLVLALMMALSLMALTTVASAAESTIPVASDFSDYNDVNDAYKEAADVVVALGIIQGKDSGLDPAGNLTRAEAVIMIERVLLGDAVVESLSGSTSSPFVDIGPSFPYGDLIAYAANTGIVSGDAGSKQFFPSDELNTVSFGKILLGALGYDSDKQGYTGSMWHINVFADMAKAGINLNGVGMFDNLTREQAMQMIFQTLKADMVYYPNDSKTPSKQVAGNTDTGYNNQIDEVVQFCEAYCSDLSLVTTGEDDDFGRPASVWKLNGTTTICKTESSTATVVYTSATTQNQINRDLPNCDFSTLTQDNVFGISKNGVAEGASGASSIDSASALAGKTGNGKLVEVFTTGTNVDKVVIVTYSVDTLQSITEKNGTTTYKFETAASKNNSSNATNVIFEGAVNEGDVVTIAKVGASDNKYYVYPTTSFTGSQTAKKSSNGTTTITVGGTNYVVGTGVTGVNEASFTNSVEELTYFVDQNGFIVGVKGAEAPAPEYALIASVAATASTVTLDNPTGYTVNVRAVLADGTVADYTLATNLTNDTDQYGTTSASGSLVAGDGNTRILLCAQGSLESSLQTTVSGNLAGNVYSYTINSNGEMVIAEMTAADNTMSSDEIYLLDMAASYKGGTSHANGAGNSTALFSNQTVFVIYGVDGTKVSAESYTGTVGLPIDTSSGVNGGQAVITATTSSRGVASVVFLETDVKAATVDYVFVDPSNATSVLKADGTGSTWQYDGVGPDGATVKVTAGDGVGAKVTKGLYAYDANGVLDTASPLVQEGDAALDSATPAEASHFYNLENATAENDLILVGKTWVDIAEAEILYTKNGLDEISGVNCFVVMNTANTASAVFVYAEYTPVAASVSLDETSATLYEDGENNTVDLTATFSAGDSGASVASYAWTTSDSSVATVSPANAASTTVTLAADGTATITCKVTLDDDESTELTATCVVTCNGIQGTTLSLAADKSALDGTTDTSTTVTPSFDAKTSDLTVKSYAYTSSDTDAATVGASGNTSTVTYVGAGNVTITCTATLSNGAKLTATTSITCS